MARIIEKAGRAAKRGMKDLEARVLATLGKRANRVKVATVTRVARRAVKASLISAALATAWVVLGERRRQHKLTS